MERTNVAIRCAGDGVRVAVLVALCLATHGCASGRSAGTIAPTVKKEASKERTITLTIPDSIGGFRLADRDNYEGPALGSRLRYVGADSMSADLFLYPGPVVGAACDTGMAVKAMADQIAGFREGFPTMIERHYVDEMLSGYFVKLRITYRFTDARLALEQTFVADLFTRLVPRQ